MQKLEQRPGSSPIFQLISYDFLILLSYKTQNYLHRGDSAHIYLTLSYQSLVNKITHRYGYRSSWWSPLVSWECIFPNDCIFVKLTKELTNADLSLGWADMYYCPRKSITQQLIIYKFIISYQELVIIS